MARSAPGQARLGEEAAERRVFERRATVFSGAGRAALNKVRKATLRTSPPGSCAATRPLAPIATCPSLGLLARSGDSSADIRPRLCSLLDTRCHQDREGAAPVARGACHSRHLARHRRRQSRSTAAQAGAASGASQECRGRQARLQSAPVSIGVLADEPGVPPTRIRLSRPRCASCADAASGPPASRGDSPDSSCSAGAALSRSVEIEVDPRKRPLAAAPQVRGAVLHGRSRSRRLR